ncbi:hypothetical protein PUNSTDRAFT_55088, partial [Punctularia strigosozonata HHB-11173 SS5]
MPAHRLGQDALLNERPGDRGVPLSTQATRTPTPSLVFALERNPARGQGASGKKRTTTPKSIPGALPLPRPPRRSSCEAPRASEIRAPTSGVAFRAFPSAL